MRRFFLTAILGMAVPFGAVAQTPDSVASLSLDSLLATPISSAAKYAQNVRQVAGSVTIVTAADIRRFGYRTLVDVLQTMAGVYTSNPRSYESLGIRGFSRPTDYNNRILLLIDGHALYESMWGQAMLGDELAINLASVERIELIRGPASALYGTGAMFGIINIIPKRGSDIAGLRVHGEMGSLGRREVGFSAGGGTDARRSFAVSGMYETIDGTRDLYFPEFDDPATNNGVVRDVDWQRRGGLALSGALGGVTLQSRLTYRRRADPTASYATIFNDERAQIVDRSAFVELGYATDLSPAHRVSARAYYDDLDYQGFYPYPDPDGLWTEAASHHIAGGEATLRWDLSARNRLTSGVEYRSNLKSEYFGPLLGDRTTNVSHPFAVWSVYAQNDWQMKPNLALLAGIRHDESGLSGGATTPRLALIYDPRPGTTLKAMYGRAFRAPNITETEYKASSVLGTLRAETLDMLELIWIQRLNDRFMLTSSAYRYHVVNLIDAVADTDAQLGLVYRNSDVANATGLELTLDGRPTRGASTYLSYSTQFAVDAGGDDRGQGLTNSPRHLIKAGFATDITSGATGAFELRYESARKTLTGANTDPFLIGNLNFTFDVPFLHDRAGISPELGLRVANVFNTRYAYPGGVEHFQSAIGQDGRTLILRLSMRF
jgi:outer membrane receptor protein involved in Fe transport